jgi:CheY-like chemotaxis protein
VLPSVFDLFVQGSRSLARSEGGLGIGLTLVRSLVELHGGTVIAHSDGAGRGSEFVVSLPALAPVPGDAQPATPPPPVPTANGRRVLVVEDNGDTAEALGMLLRILGYTVDIARDGEDALARARAALPEIALLDIGLPTMDGYDLARRLRALPGGEAVRMVALSGYGQDRARNAEAGFQVHLVKPVELGPLLQAISPGGSRS